jgi:hypothetical protein
VLAVVEAQIKEHDLRVVILDSYTAMRASRQPKSDLVKVERSEISMLDQVAKHNQCTLLLIHHDSKGSFGMDWSDRSAGTYAMGAAAEAQIHVSRFRDLPVDAKERLVQVRGRHFGGFEGVIRFRAETLDYELVLEGSLAPLFEDLIQLKQLFGDRSFSPKDLYHDAGMSRPTSHRMLSRLTMSGAVRRDGYGQYSLKKELLDKIK